MFHKRSARNIWQLSRGGKTSRRHVKLMKHNKVTSNRKQTARSVQQTYVSQPSAHLQQVSFTTCEGWLFTWETTTVHEDREVTCTRVLLSHLQYLPCFFATWPLEKLSQLAISRDTSTPSPHSPSCCPTPSSTALSQRLHFLHNNSPYQCFWQRHHVQERTSDDTNAMAIFISESSNT